VHDWLIWLIASGALAAAESVSLDFVLVMCAGGAAAGAITAGAGAPPSIQIVVALIVAGLLLAFARPVAKRHLLNTGGHISGTAALVGKDAVVLSTVDAQHGLVRLNGAEWTARSFDKTQVLEPGDTVKVMEISGATAVVWQSP
jgi:membrane protein implicated in regulation of membrane protease activity